MHQVHYKSSTMYKHQQGVTLIEVLVSMVLMAIIGLGAAYISGRTAVMHRDQNLHLHTVNQMRQYLESSTGTSCTNNIDIEVAEKKSK
ncbi:PulJ/GspJ family protein [Acinetobacter indicus]|uniref:PulJ/GspJ family protein n=1 Tax=Acinetobacter indicus TaxID=756892 RepID=UPI0014439258|nr:prepilin-type N-terminal cleavage/methylation domain-containing protein [Acinetobacter indicus]